MGTKVYFFRDKQYLRYDRGNNQIDPDFPISVDPAWPGFKDLGFEEIDAALSLGNGKAYFFHDDKYLRYDIATDTVDAGFPINIIPNWPGFDTAGFTKIDAAVNWGNGKAYFFHDDKYLQYDIATDTVDSSLLIDPELLGQGWPGFKAAGFDKSVKGVLDLYLGDLKPSDPSNKELWIRMGDNEFSGSAGNIIVHTEKVKATAVGPVFSFLPWRGVLHTTESYGTPPHALQDNVNFFKPPNKPNWPHFTVDPRGKAINQHIPLNIGSRALRDGTVTHNGAHCIQIEIVGKADDTQTWSLLELDVIKYLMREIENLVPIPRVSSRAFLDKSLVWSVPNNRMTEDEWKNFSGWCGHQHVPLPNDHYDPGAINILYLLGL